MVRSGLILQIGVAAVIVWGAMGGAEAQELAKTPPMGWNSWDSYGTTVNEAEVKANADWMAKHLKAAGWDYIVVDMEWFVKNPIPEGNAKNSAYATDGHGRYVPAVNRFPSAAGDSGFGPLAVYVHGLGLKFGIHILQGVPRVAAGGDATIAGSDLRVAAAANITGTCAWNSDNYDVKDDSAGQAYYDSLMRMYAKWGVDLIKVDCIASRPYKGAEIAMIAKAIAKTGRPIALSLSPGEAPLDKVAEMRKGAAMWRISDDVWDRWHSDVAYPQGLGDQIPRLAKWTGIAIPGHWPDADMLPLGYLGPAPGWGEARETRLTHDEQRTLLTLWSVFRSPLMIGGELTRMDKWTETLLTNREVIAVDQASSENRPIDAGNGLAVWVAKAGDGQARYVAVVNTSEAARDVSIPVQQLGWQTGQYRMRDLWERKDVGRGTSVNARLAPHACVLYRAERVY